MIHFGNFCIRTIYIKTDTFDPLIYLKSRDVEQSLKMSHFLDANELELLSKTKDV